MDDKKKPTKKPTKSGKSGVSVGSGGMGPYFGGVKNNPAIIPGVKEQ